MSKCCDLFSFDPQKVDKIKETFADDEQINCLSDLFKILGDSTKTKILLSLSKGELCVCDITNILGMNLSAISHQLRILRSAGLVTYRSEGKMAFYQLKDKSILKLIKEGIKNLK